MTDTRSLHVIFAFLWTLNSLFSLFRRVRGRKVLRHFDAEKEVGHGMMAIGVLFMLAPAGWLSADILSWNMFVFAAASLWWTCRLFVRKPLLALLLQKNLGWQACLEQDLLQRRQVGCGIFTETQLFAPCLAPKGELLPHTVPRLQINEGQSSW
jgi:hypothetical protein